MYKPVCGWIIQCRLSWESFVLPRGWQSVIAYGSGWTENWEMVFLDNKLVDTCVSVKRG